MKFNIKNITKILENKYLKQHFSFYTSLNIGDFLEIEYYSINEKRNLIYEGQLISKKNISLNKTFTIRQIIEGIGVEQTFFINSPNIINIKKIKEAKESHSKLYYLRK
jgi:large subunit ribosomal protein L19